MLRIQIRTFLVGFRSRLLGPDPSLIKWPYINFFGVCKSHKYLMNICYLTFWVMTIPVLLSSVADPRCLSRILDPTFLVIPDPILKREVQNKPNFFLPD
jgi:hypothetical protein